MQSKQGDGNQNSSCGCKSNTTQSLKQNTETLTFEGGSDVFTSNRHTLHNNEAKSFNFMKYRTQDDAPFFRPSAPSSNHYISATVPVEREGCERVSALMLRSNLQWGRHALALTGAGLLAFGLIRWAKSDSQEKADNES